MRQVSGDCVLYYGEEVSLMSNIRCTTKSIPCITGSSFCSSGESFVVSGKLDVPQATSFFYPVGNSIRATDFGILQQCLKH